MAEIWGLRSSLAEFFASSPASNAMLVIDRLEACYSQESYQHVKALLAACASGTPDHAWKIGGLIYFNPHDPAIWVEQRVGLGYTLNIGNSRAWLLIGMMVAPVPPVSCSKVAAEARCFRASFDPTHADVDHVRRRLLHRLRNIEA